MKCEIKINNLLPTFTSDTIHISNTKPLNAKKSMTWHDCQKCHRYSNKAVSDGGYRSGQTLDTTTWLLMHQKGTSVLKGIATLLNTRRRNQDFSSDFQKYLCKIGFQQNWLLLDIFQMSTWSFTLLHSLLWLVFWAYFFRLPICNEVRKKVLTC